MEDEHYNREDVYVMLFIFSQGECLFAWRLVLAKMMIIPLKKKNDNNNQWKIREIKKNEHDSNDCILHGCLSSRLIYNGIMTLQYR